MKSIDSKKTKCLIIHGFGGGVHEVKPLAEYLTGLNYDVFCPILEGHSTTRKDMNKATYTDWIESAERELLRLKESRNEIVLIGFSMGGLIAFNLACKHSIKAIVTINTPIYYWNLFQVFLNLMDDLKHMKCNNLKRYMRAKNNSPFLAMIQFLMLLHHTKPKLENITCPILITQAKDDDTVRLKSVDYIYNQVSSVRKETRYFNEGGHLILLSPMAEKVFLGVKEFIQDS